MPSKHMVNQNYHRQKHMVKQPNLDNACLTSGIQPNLDNQPLNNHHLAHDERKLIVMSMMFCLMSDETSAKIQIFKN